MRPSDRSQPPPGAGSAGSHETIELHGRRLRLRTTVEADRVPLTTIRRTPEVLARWRGEDLDGEFDELLARVGEVWPLTIEDERHRVVGYLQFAEEDDPDYRHASIDIYIDPASHRLGYGREAISVVVEYLFGQRGHHRITIDPAADNEAAIGCYASVGFRPVGVMRAYERQADGSWGDGLLMDLVDGDDRS